MLPNNSCNKIFISKYFITKHLQWSLFMVINIYENYTVWFQKIFCQLQTLFHKGEPLTVPKWILYIYKLIVVNKIFISSIVGWVNVNQINCFMVSKIQNRERVIIVALNQQIYRLAFVAINFFAFCFFQNRKRLARHFIRKHFAWCACVRIDENINFFFRQIPMPNEAVFRFLDMAKLFY